MLRINYDNVITWMFWYSL